MAGPENSSELGRTAGDLRVAIGRVARRLRDLYAASESGGDLTFREVSILSRLLRTGPATPGALAQDENVSPQAIGSVIGGLQRRGLIARDPDATDGRRVIISITKRGKGAFDDGSHIVSAHLAHVLAVEFKPAEQQQLADVLTLLERLADRL